MEDLTAASYQDVVEFFKKYYGPGNASLVIAGDIDPAATRTLVEKWFGEVKAGPPVEPLVAPAAMLTEVKRKTIFDRVQLPRLYLAWLTPRHFAPGDAELDIAAQVLARGKNSRLYKRLVYELQIAQDVTAFQGSSALASSFGVIVTAKPKPGESKTPAAMIADVQRIVDEEIDKLRQEPPSAREMERAINQYEASFYGRMERVGGFGGKADLLNAYYFATRNPDYFNEDLARYRALTARDVQAAARAYLPRDRRVELIIEPEGAKKSEEVKR